MMSLSASAQFSRLRNQPLYDKAPLHFGFHMGINYYNFNMDLKDLSKVEDIFAVEAPRNEREQRSFMQTVQIGGIAQVRLSVAGQDGVTPGTPRGGQDGVTLLRVAAAEHGSGLQSEVALAATSMFEILGRNTLVDGCGSTA